MVVTGVIDQLEYYDVQLGMGALCIYPKPGTTCLVGIIEGQETDAFLISADEVDEIVLNGGTLGGLVKVGELTERLNLIEKDINSLKQKLSGWTPVPNDGGSALKTALSSYISESLKETQVRDIENERVKQKRTILDKDGDTELSPIRERRATGFVIGDTLIKIGNRA